MLAVPATQKTDLTTQEIDYENEGNQTVGKKS